MAKIASEWMSLGSSITASDGWATVKAHLKAVDEQLPNEGVYVIRTVRPFSIAYPKKPSPVLYIGEGNTKLRLRKHLKTWVVDLAKDFPSLKIEIRYTRPVTKKNKARHRDVEADLLWRFCKDYGALPLLNKQNEYHDRIHTYASGFMNILNPGSGRGFKWALMPISSNHNYIRKVDVED
ncbi:hypothetical protein [Loktanella sp. M215]|uniref:hypothetical protein n=1 Tax=Loktanella sp. M215 TaxID=2675431 RepID=UPI001F469117|nr:hypothetical protein [Loktanella sp. M215]MCF7698475.1 hypothetical protein [Loktanella sp. M215]